MDYIIIIAGGIGAGKSIVSKILRAMGYTVYDCDLEAKKIMDSHHKIHNELNKHIHPSIVVNGVIDRKLLSQIVFNDKGKLARLNAIVHHHVVRDVKDEATRHHKDSILFVETAIPYESGLDKICSCMWEVTAPLELRIKRVMRRNNCNEEQVRARIKSQNLTTHPSSSLALYTINNDEVEPLLPQIDSLLNNWSLIINK